MSDITWTNITVKLGDLKPWADNPRHSTKSQAKRILASFDRFGQVAPIAVSPALEVYDGHQRLSALLTVHGADYAVEARQSSRPLTDDERRGLVLALANATGSWDWDRLSAWNTADLDQWGFDADTLKGWKEDVTALGEYLKSEKPAASDAEVDESRADELREKWGTERGQVWSVGKHLVLCEDSTNADAVAKIINNRAVDIILTDPPYSSGGFQDGLKRNSTSIGTRQNISIARDNLTSKGFIALMGRVLGNVDAEVCYLFTDWRMWSWAFDALESSGYPVRNMLVWDKEQMGMGFPWRSQHELIAFSKRSGGEIMDGKSGNVLKAKRTGNENHPTEKPVDLLEQMLDNTKGETVYDPFMGSGSTLVACENMGRQGRGIELSPAYVAVALERMATAFPGIDIRRLE